MKYLLVALIGHFVTLSLAQSSELNQANKLIKSFETEKSVALLEEADALVTKAFDTKNYRPDSKALLTKARVKSLILKNTELEDPLAYSEEIISIYNDALEADSEMQLRHDILQELYLAKVKMMDIGNKAYEAGSYADAHSNYQNALKLNALEIEYPRHAKLDTSILFSGAVFAKLGDKNKAAITDFEKLAEMKYNRIEVYDYLIELYEKEGMEAKVDAIKKTKAEMFPE